jgi:hypothetical protein
MSSTKNKQTLISYDFTAADRKLQQRWPTNSTTLEQGHASKAPELAVATLDTIPEDIQAYQE